MQIITNSMFLPTDKRSLILDLIFYSLPVRFQVILGEPSNFTMKVTKGII